MYQNVNHHNLNCNKAKFNTFEKKMMKMLSKKVKSVKEQIYGDTGK